MVSERWPLTVGPTRLCCLGACTLRWGEVSSFSPWAAGVSPTWCLRHRQPLPVGLASRNALRG